MAGNLYKVLAETMGEGLLMVDTMGKILAVNSAFEQMTGYPSRELVGQSCRILNCTGCKVLGGGPDKLWCGLFEKGSVRDRRCEITGRSGRIIHIMKHATTLHDKKGHVSGAVEIMTDISEVVFKEEEIRSLRSTLRQQAGISGIVGVSRTIRELLVLIENVSLSSAPVLIYGESGVGKELVSRAVHDFGGRSEQSFIKINCASLNENLLESELFGHVRGAFTGASRNRIGRFEAASGGSIFLDEIGDISPAIQVKLLRVLETKEIERVGDHEPIPVDVRIIAATNKKLEELVAQGLFREDLFYRINVVPLYVPPLRERREDIPLLAQTFIDRIAAQSGKPISGLSAQALEKMVSHDWPGNVRELQNTIEYAFVLCHGPLIGPEHLPSQLSGQPLFRTNPPEVDCIGTQNPGIEMERQRLIQALKESGGSPSKAATILGVSRVTVWKRMKKFGVRKYLDDR